MRIRAGKQAMALVEYMDLKMQEYFRAKLISIKQNLLADIYNTINGLKHDGGVRDENDVASQEEIFHAELLTRSREARLIKKIDFSLRQLERHEYGYCEQCGEEIGYMRLNARPTATMCIDCKKLQEIKEQQSGRAFFRDWAPVAEES